MNFRDGRQSKDRSTPPIVYWGARSKASPYSSLVFLVQLSSQLLGHRLMPTNDLESKVPVKAIGRSDVHMDAILLRFYGQGSRNCWRLLRCLLQHLQLH